MSSHMQRSIRFAVIRNVLHHPPPSANQPPTHTHTANGFRLPSSLIDYGAYATSGHRLRMCSNCSIKFHLLSWMIYGPRMNVEMTGKRPIRNLLCAPHMTDCERKWWSKRAEGTYWHSSMQTSIIESLMWKSDDGGNWSPRASSDNMRQNWSLTYIFTYLYAGEPIFLDD